MKKINLIILLLCMSYPAFTQNLVPNPGFEFFVPRPKSERDSAIAKGIQNRAIMRDCYKLKLEGWHCPRLMPYWVHAITTDTIYYQDMGVEMDSSRHHNRAGLLYMYKEELIPKEGKNCVILKTAYFRNFLQVPLKEPLKPGKIYYAEMWVKTLLKHELDKRSCNNLGMYFSDTLLKPVDLEYTFFTPQINETKVIEDTLNWVAVKGTFKAKSAAKYLIIGNFYPIQETTIKNLTYNVLIYSSFYIIIEFLLDDIYVGEGGKRKKHLK